jgi:hypothetical protein
MRAANGHGLLFGFKAVPGTVQNAVLRSSWDALNASRIDFYGGIDSVHQMQNLKSSARS